MPVEAKKNAVRMGAVMKDHAFRGVSRFLVSCLFSHVTSSQNIINADVPQG